MSVKFGVLIVKLRSVDAVRVPEVPVIVIAAVPGVTVLLTAMVSVLFPVAGFGEKDAVTPLGRPDTARFTLLEKPYWEVRKMVDVPEPPSFIVRFAGEAKSVKLGA